MSDPALLLPDELKKWPTTEKWSPTDGPAELCRLAEERGLVVVLELKQRTETTRYWLCTQGSPEARPDVPEGWIVGTVTPQVLVDKEWQSRPAYTARSVGRLKEYESLARLGAEMQRLQEEEQPTPEIQRQIDDRRAAIQTVLRQLQSTP